MSIITDIIVVSEEALRVLPSSSQTDSRMNFQSQSFTLSTIASIEGYMKPERLRGLLAKNVIIYIIQKLKDSLKIEGGILIEAGKEIKAFEELAKL